MVSKKYILNKINLIVTKKLIIFRGYYEKI